LIKGSDNTDADVLSRILHRKAGKEYIIEDETTVSAAMIATVNLFEKSNRNAAMRQLSSGTPQHQDQEYGMLKLAIIKIGWPEQKIDLAQNLEPFWSQRYKLSIDEDGFIVKERRLFAPARQTSPDIPAQIASKSPAGRQEGSPHQKVDLVAIHKPRHQKHCKNLPSMPRKITKSSSGTRTCSRGSPLPIPVTSHGPGNV
jgi:hypothetical protein